jgi:rhodanese-related sulfurtransferase
MDGSQITSIDSRALFSRLGTASAPVVVDVRRPLAFSTGDRLIVSAFHQLPDQVDQWAKGLPRQRSIVVHCVHGHEVSQAVAASLRAMDFDAVYLEGGIVGWIDLDLPTRKNIGPSPGKWVTREHPKVDRIACPWLVQRFIDPRAEFIYVPANQVLAVAKAQDATPYDIDGVEFTHEGERCSFDAILKIYDIHEPALDRLAAIVRGADTPRRDLTPQSEGLLAISRGLSANFPDDHEMLRHGMVIYDAFFAWCRQQHREAH